MRCVAKTTNALGDPEAVTALFPQALTPAVHRRVHASMHYVAIKGELR